MWFATKREARDHLTRVESDRLDGAWVDPRLGRTTFAEWAARFMATTHHLKPKTVAGYESLLRAHLLPCFGRTSLVKIEPLDVREWVSDLVAAGLSPSRARQAYQLLSMIMKAAVESRIIARTPCVGVKLKRAPAREMLFLGAVEVDRLAAAAGSYSLLVYVLAYGGLRWGEACALRRKRYDQIRGRLEVAESLAEVNGVVHWGETKTYARRSVVLPRFVRALLDSHIDALASDPDALLFTAPEGGPLRNSNFRRKIWFPALVRAMLPRALRIHDLRHTCASLLIAENANPKAIQAHLGHSSIAVTFDRYGHLFPNDMDRLADALDARWRAERDDPSPAAFDSKAYRRH